MPLAICALSEPKGRRNSAFSGQDVVTQTAKSNAKRTHSCCKWYGARGFLRVISQCVHICIREAVLTWVYWYQGAP
eukprot:2461482-Rhodomonas_salina.13